jgi:hypothetical protein
MKRISFTCDDWFYDYFLIIPSNNRSAFIRELIASGEKILTGDNLSNRIAMQKYIAENETLKKKVHILELEIGKLKSLNSKKGLMTEQEMKIAYHKAWTMQGGMH